MIKALLAILFLTLVYEAASETPKSKLVGVWDLSESDNFEEYMKELGVGWFMRKMGNMVRPTVTFTQNGNDWEMKLTSTFKSSDTKFTIGKEFDEKTLDDRESKTTFTLETPDKLVQVQRDPHSRREVTTIIREVKDGKLYQTLKVNNVTARRTYTRTS